METPRQFLIKEWDLNNVPIKSGSAGVPPASFKSKWESYFVLIPKRAWSDAKLAIPEYENKICFRGKNPVILFWVLLVFLLFPTNGFSRDNGEILVFAGAGMRVPLMEIGKRFEEKSGIEVVYDFAGSGRLGNKILMGQRPDLFIPGSDKWANILKEKGLVKTIIPMAYHIPVIITPKNSHKVNSLEDFVLSQNRIVLGDPKAAAIGGISTAIFKKAGIHEEQLNVRARAVTVKQLILWIEGNNADAAIVWRADAVQSENVRWIDIPEANRVTNIIPICPLTENKNATKQFLDYLTHTQGASIFEKHGFVVIK